MKMASQPIVLAHGYLGFSTLGPFQYFNNVATVLAGAGATQVFAPDVQPKGSLTERATQLGDAIADHFGNQKVHVIAHSMGGLDVRHLIASGATNIASLTTVGTPFRGTFVADVVADPSRLSQVNPGNLLAAIERYEVELFTQWPFAAATRAHEGINQLREAVERLASGDYSQLANYFRNLFSIDDDALKELTTEKCRQNFPDDQGDMRGVPSYSYAGASSAASVSPPFTIPAILLNSIGQDNDGVVPLASAKLQNHRGTLPLDHLGLIGWGADVSGIYRQIYATITT